MGVNNGGPAFPVNGFIQPNGDFTWPESGLTKLEYFAAKAMAPLVENATKGHSSYGNEIEIAKRAFDIAEAMLAESEKRNARVD